MRRMSPVSDPPRAQAALREALAIAEALRATTGSPPRKRTGRSKFATHAGASPTLVASAWIIPACAVRTGRTVLNNLRRFSARSHLFDRHVTGLFGCAPVRQIDRGLKPLAPKGNDDVQASELPNTDYHSA